MTDYYTKQLAQITGENKAFTILSDAGDTDILKLNLESIAALQQWLDVEKNRIIDSLEINHLSYDQRRHNIGLALAKLTGIKRDEINQDHYYTPIGSRTPIGLYETIKSVLNDSPEYPRYEELFPPLRAYVDENWLIIK